MTKERNSHDYVQRHVSTVLTEEQKHKLRVAAAEHNMTLSKYIAKLLEKATKNYIDLSLPEDKKK